MKNNVLHTAGKFTALIATGAMILLCGPAATPVAARSRTAGPTPASAQEQILLDFTRTGQFGLDSASGLIQDAEGNLYGTTEKGGQGEGGTVFELSPRSGGGWTAQVLYDFQRYGVNGSAPVAGLVFDAAGNLYGTTANGGIGNGLCATTGCGTVFELSPQSGGGWSEKVLYSFQNAGGDGFAPTTKLIFDGVGNLYGTTESGAIEAGSCPFGCGIVFELSPQSGGNWTESVLYTFTGGPDGGSPVAGLVRDASGILYGTASVGGTAACNDSGCGTVFELKQKPGGSWIEKTLHDFQGNGTDGGNPVGGLIFDGSGNLYGTTSTGGSTGICNQYGCGTVFKLSPKSGGEDGKRKYFTVSRVIRPTARVRQPA